jgi:hypothetical protein
MATDIYNKKSRNWAGAFSIDQAQLTLTGLGSTGTTGLLVQNIQINYQQQVSFVYDLAKADDVYYIAGRTQGTLALGKVVGSQGIVKQFYTTYGDVCAIRDHSLELNGISGCSSNSANPPTGTTGTITIKQPIITQFGITMSINDAIIGENVQMIFATLELP